MDALEEGGQTPKATGHIPGEPGLWILIFGDLLVFSLFFGVFAYYRGQSVDLFTESQTHLSQAYGLFNTFLLLTSSWFVASAVKAARKNQGKQTFKLLALGLTCGAGFLIVKVFEYGEKIANGLVLTTNEFYMFYFMLTGIHGLHVIIGMTALAVLMRSSRTMDYTAQKVSNLEAGASFWHVVDLLWIVLFSLLYLA